MWLLIADSYKTTYYSVAHSIVQTCYVLCRSGCFSVFLLISHTQLTFETAEKLIHHFIPIILVLLCQTDKLSASTVCTDVDSTEHQDMFTVLH